jgi:hypothetical protein
MHNDNTVAVHAEVAAAGIDHVQPVPFLLADVSRLQVIDIQEFDDLAFKEHEKIQSCGTFPEV